MSSTDLHQATKRVRDVYLKDNVTISRAMLTEWLTKGLGARKQMSSVESAWRAVPLNVSAILFFQPVSAIIRHLSAGIIPRVLKLLTHSFPSVRTSHRRGEWKRRGAAGPVELCKSDAVSSSGTQDCAKPDAEPLQWKMYTAQRLMQSHHTPLSFLFFKSFILQQKLATAP